MATTLWSHVPIGIAQEAQNYLNDYHLSFFDMGNEVPEKLSPKHTNMLHSESLYWLQNQLQLAVQENRQVVVLTHMTPSMTGTSNPRYDGNNMSHCFSTDLTPLLKDPVRIWACGHTHYNFDIDIAATNNHTRLVSNQRGYPGKQSNGYDKNGIVLRL